MPHLSARAQAMPESPIRKLAPLAEAAKARGLHVYHLNIGQPDLATPPEFFAAIAEAKLRVLEYAPSAGFMSYRRRMTDYYAQRGIRGLTADNIFITTGASEALRFAFMACLNPGDEVIVPEPFYANYLGFATESGVVLKPIRTYIEESFALPEIAAFQALVGPRTKAILLCNPSNPTGKLYPEQELLALSELVRTNDLYLFADEVYKEFCYDGQTFKSAMTLEGIEQNVVVMDSVSKRYSGCGARIGSLVSRNTALLAGVMKFAQARLSPPTLEQIGAEALVSLPQSYYDGVVAEYASRRDVAMAALSAMPGVVCPKVSGAFYLMPRLPIDDAERFCRWLLEDFSHAGATVMLAAGSGFYVTPAAGHDEVRMAYVLEKPALTQALACLAAALQAYPGRTAAATPALQPELAH